MIDDVVARVAAIRVGHPLDPGTEMGLVIDRKQYRKSLDAIDAATATGASVLTGGGRPDSVGPDGWYLAVVVAGLGELMEQLDEMRRQLVEHAVSRPRHEFVPEDQPTVLADMAPDDPAAVEEIFGPVLSVLTFRDEAEAIEIANASEYGLTGAVWTRDVTAAHRVAGRLRAGYVAINGGSRHYWGLPFGGVKSSGVGREESFDELVSYTETKAVTVVLE